MEDPFQNPVSFSNQAKPKVLKLKLILGGIFFVLFLLILFSLVYSFNFWRNDRKDNLIELAPVDSVLYATFRNSFFGKTKIIDLPIDNFYQGLSQKDFLKEIDFYSLLNNTKRLSVVLFPLNEENFGQVYIFELASQSYPKPKSGFEISKNIFVFAENKQSIEKVMEVKNGNIFSLSGQVDLKYIEKNLFSLYINPNNLKSYFKPKNNFFDEFIFELLTDNMYIGLNKKIDQYIFDIKSPFKDFKTSKSEMVFDHLPNNFSFYISGVNLFDLFFQWGKSNPQLLESFCHAEKSFESIYSSNLSDWAGTFLNRDIDLLVFDSGKESLFGFDYIIGGRNFIESDIDSLRNIVKVLMAQRYPKESEYILPDKTKVVEFLADTDRWQWQISKSESNLEINYLLARELNFKIAYLVKDNSLFLASSPEILENYFSQNDTSTLETVSSCGVTKTWGRGIIFNPKKPFFIPQIYLPSGLIVGQSGRLGFEGCILKQ